MFMTHSCCEPISDGTLYPAIVLFLLEHFDMRSNSRWLLRGPAFRLKTRTDLQGIGRPGAGPRRRSPALLTTAAAGGDDGGLWELLYSQHIRFSLKDVLRHRSPDPSAVGQRNDACRTRAGEMLLCISVHMLYVQQWRREKDRSGDRTTAVFYC